MSDPLIQMHPLRPFIPRSPICVVAGLTETQLRAKYSDEEGRHDDDYRFGRFYTSGRLA